MTESSEDNHGSQGRITQLLSQVREGDPHSTDKLVSLVYNELRGLARTIIFQDKRGQTLQPTALVHEAFIKMEDHLQDMDNRRCFFVVAARAMRQVLADYAQAKRAKKRGEGAQQFTLDTNILAGKEEAVDLVALDDSLDRLSALNSRHAQVVELRIFGGLSVEETALALKVSPRSVKSDWAMAKAWLRKELAAE